MNKEDLDFLNSESGDNYSETKICIHSKSLDSNSDVVREIKNFSPADGWISYQSTTAKRVRGADFEVEGEHILSGEFYNINGTSLAVRFDGEKWNFFTCSESDDGDSVLKKNVKQLSKEGNNIYLNYDVYYRFDENFGYRPYCSAFTGFSEEK